MIYKFDLELQNNGTDTKLGRYRIIFWHAFLSLLPLPLNWNKILVILKATIYLNDPEKYLFNTIIGRLRIFCFKKMPLLSTLASWGASGVLPPQLFLDSKLHVYQVWLKFLLVYIYINIHFYFLQ